MRNTFIYLFIIIFIISFGCIQKYENYLEISQIEKLMSRRMEIINNFLYSEKDMLRLRTELSKIEDEKLLMSDLEFLTKVFYNPTDYERIDELVIENIDKIEVTKNDVNVVCKIKWKMVEDKEKSVATIIAKDYNIRCVKKSNNLYLTNLEAID